MQAKTYEQWLKSQPPEAEVKRRAQMLGRCYIEPEQRYDSYVRECRATTINFMDEIQKPSDRGLLGGMPKLE